MSKLDQMTTIARTNRETLPGNFKRPAQNKGRHINEYYIQTRNPITRDIGQPNTRSHTLHIFPPSIPGHHSTLPNTANIIITKTCPINEGFPDPQAVMVPDLQLPSIMLQKQAGRCKGGCGSLRVASPHFRGRIDARYSVWCLVVYSVVTL